MDTLTCATYIHEDVPIQWNIYIYTAYADGTNIIHATVDAQVAAHINIYRAKTRKRRRTKTHKLVLKC